MSAQRSSNLLLSLIRWRPSRAWQIRTFPASTRIVRGASQLWLNAIPASNKTFGRGCGNSALSFTESPFIKNSLRNCASSSPVSSTTTACACCKSLSSVSPMYEALLLVDNTASSQGIGERLSIFRKANISRMTCLFLPYTTNTFLLFAVAIQALPSYSLLKRSIRSRTATATFWAFLDDVKSFPHYAMHLHCHSQYSQRFSVD